MNTDALFEAELADFVATRDALAKQLKAGGDKEGAAAVKALRKPSTVAWGINRVIRTHRDDVDELIEAAGAVRAAQVRAVQGNDAGGLREASRGWRAKINQLAAAVATLVGDQYRDEAAATFEASSVDEALGEILKAGRFTAAVTAAGFGLAGMPDPPVRPSIETEPDPAPEPPPAVDEAAVDEARATLESRETAVEKALFRLRRAEQRLDQARQAVDEARVAHEETVAARDAAAEEVTKLTS